MNSRLFIITTIVIAALTCFGCVTQLRNEQLKAVAKDWSYIIRASQIIPVYPLTEDLQPGDILLVRTPIEQQTKLFEEKGFLPLDQLVKRLNPNGYKEFYGGRYNTDNSKVCPAQWQDMKNSQHQWDDAPNAAFPTYNFDVATGTGFNVAVPVQGIPIALGLMNSGKAKGTLVIGKAYTFGLDNSRLYDDVKQWAKQYRSTLAAYGPPPHAKGATRYQFLRVVSRVYAIGEINVTITNEEATGADLSGGADKSVDLPILSNVTSNYRNARALNAAVGKDFPGGKIKFASASRRAVSLNEQFPRPLVVGYVGFDIPILEGGRLGAPISTYSQLTNETAPSDIPKLIANGSRLAALSHVHNALLELQGKRRNEILNRLNAIGVDLPEVYPFTAYSKSEPDVLKTQALAGQKVERRDFRGVIDYINYSSKTIEVLEDCKSRENGCAGIDKTNIDAALKSAALALENVTETFKENPAIIDAVEYVFLEN